MEPTPRQRIKTPAKERTLYEKYTLTHWGDTPYPSLASPTPQEAEEVYTRLMAAHGDRLRPAHITAPSLDVAGCGEVPQVIDAIIRTMLSANTTFDAADAALQKLRRASGTICEKQVLDDADRAKLEHCLDYIHILKSMGQDKLAVAISPAGGQKKKAAFILAILEDVWAMNKERTDAFKEEVSGGSNLFDSDSFLLAADCLTDEEKQWEIRMFEKGILNLEFLKKLSADDAMNKMLGWAGIGVKTAACVLLFCMQQDILACDTHCVRLSKWLGWAPVEATDNLVFAQVDNRVPDKLKYSLHQLFIQHGKDCLRCRDSTSAKTPGWKEAVCPLEDLVDRNSLKTYKNAKAAARQAKLEIEEAEESEDETEEAEDKAEKAENAELEAAEMKVKDEDEDEDADWVEARPPKGLAQRKTKNKVKPKAKGATLVKTQTKLQNMGKVGKPGVGKIGTQGKAGSQMEGKQTGGEQTGGQPMKDAVAYDGPITRKRSLEIPTPNIDSSETKEAPIKRPNKRAKTSSRTTAPPTNRQTRAQARLEVDQGTDGV